jgi:hypothetical protein
MIHATQDDLRYTGTLFLFPEGKDGKRERGIFSGVEMSKILMLIAILLALSECAEKP